MTVESQRPTAGLVTVEEYLAMERQAETKSEYIDGQVVAMTGASLKHNRISWNLAAALDPQLERGDCQGLVADMRVWIPAARHYTYPDLVVVCGAPELQDEHFDTLTNPTLIAEILSPSTEGYDHGQKFAHYRTLPTLEEYLLVAQAKVHIERFTRQDDDRWVLAETTHLDATLDLAAVGCHLKVADVYRGVPDVAT